MGRRVQQAIRNIWISVGIALLILVLLESVVRAGIALRYRGRAASEEAAFEARLRADAPVGPDWAQDYLLEFAEARQAEWHPYVYWRTKPHRGKYINIDQMGFRRTWSSTAAPSPGQLRIYMFGGSTVWGSGVRDEFTIPSLVSKKLADRLPTGVWVANFGQPGYVSTQEVIALMLELQRGNVPDIVVYYDGLNDILSALQNRVAGIPQNERNRVAEFNSRDRLNFQEGFIENFALYRVSQWVVRMSRGTRVGSDSGTNVPLVDPLASDVIDGYLGNVRLVRALADRFGFKAVFFWQPTVFSKRSLSQRENGLYRHRLGWAAGSFRKVNAVLRERIGTGKFEDIHDLSGIFDNDAGTIFKDPWHVVEPGNDKIAESVAHTLLSVARAKR